MELFFRFFAEVTCRKQDLGKFQADVLNGVLKGGRWNSLLSSDFPCFEQENRESDMYAFQNELKADLSVI